MTLLKVTSKWEDFNSFFLLSILLKNKYTTILLHQKSQGTPCSVMWDITVLLQCPSMSEIISQSLMTKKPKLCSCFYYKILLKNEFCELMKILKHFMCCETLQSLSTGDEGLCGVLSNFILSLVSISEWILRVSSYWHLSHKVCCARSGVPGALSLVTSGLNP